ncbi:MAG: hypothetical protein IJL32_09625 [Oscillospiraceae bacterium]|nr:hypothetical protein [Oscillospiraceae bacterium]MBQ9905958.1 hypothetical protein [Oscillospiraceae bacterium]
MKENEYMNIMSGIREEFIEEAVSWDGSERKRIRQIRRMTTGFGAVAAAIAVVVGTIAYKERKDDLLAADSQESETESVTEDTTLNLFGGHGDIEVIKSLWCDNFYRDDDYWYDGTVKWSVRSSGEALPCTTVSSMIQNKTLYADDQQLYRVYDGKIFVTDGFGNETELVDMNQWKNGNGGLYEIAENLDRIQKVGDALLLECYSTQVQDSAVAEVSFDDENPDLECPDDENLNCCAFCYDVICVNLKDGSANTMEGAESSMVIGSDDTGFYTYSYTSRGIHRYDFNGRLQGNEPVWAFTDDASLMYAKYADGKLYAVLDYADYNIDPATGETVYETTRKEYRIYDIASGDETTISADPDENILIGKMLYRARFEDGRFVIDRYTLDMDDQRTVYAVTASELWDTEHYPLPRVDIMNIAEADGELLIALPTVQYNGDAVPTLHGEAMAVVDVFTGKVLYSGRDYNRQNENSAVTTTADNKDADSTSQTTVIRDNVNYLGGTGVLEAFGNSMLCADDTRVYDLQSGNVWKKPASGSGLMEQDGFICTEPGCQHDSDKCFAYRWNIADLNQQEKNVKLLTCGSDVYGVRGSKCWYIDPLSGTETLCMEITQSPDGKPFGQDEVLIRKITPLQVSGGTGAGRITTFLVEYLIGSDDGIGGTRTLAVYDCTSNSTRPFLAEKNNSDGIYADGIDWDKVETDDKNTENVYVLKDLKTLVVLNRECSIITEMDLPLADGITVSYEDWAIYDGQMYYQTESGQYFRYSLATGENQLLQDVSPVRIARGRWYETDGVVIVPDLQTGSQSIYVNQPDFAQESMQYTADDTAPLYGISGITRKNDQFTVAYASGDALGLYTFTAPQRAN